MRKQSLLALVGVFLPLQVCGQNLSPDAGLDGTYRSVDVSPDGRWIVFDRLGRIYVVSSAGGRAVRVASMPTWAYEPKFSDGGRTISFLAGDRESNDNRSALWKIATKGSGWSTHSRPEMVRTNLIAALLVGGSDYAIARSDRMLEYAFNGHRCETPVARLGPGETLRGLTFSRPLNRLFVVSVGNPGRETVYSLDPVDCVASAQKWSEGAALAPVASPYGMLIAYLRPDPRGAQLRVHDLRSNTDRLVFTGDIPLDIDQFPASGLSLRGAPGYAFAPDGKSIYISVGTRIKRIFLDGTVREIAVQVADKRIFASRAKASRGAPAPVIRWPTQSTNGEYRLWERAGGLWLTRKGGESTRIDIGNAFPLSPSVDPSGKLVAFVAAKSDGRGAVVVMDLASRATQILSKTEGRFGGLAWSPDGTLLAFRGEGSARDVNKLWVANRVDGSLRDYSIPGDRGGHWTSPYGALTFGGSGTKLWFRGKEAVDAPSSVYAIDLKAGGYAKVLALPRSEQDSAIFSPDGEKVVMIDRFAMSIGEVAAQSGPFENPAAGKILFKRAGIVPYATWISDDTVLYSAGSQICTLRVPSRTPKCDVVIHQRPGIAEGGASMLIKGGTVIEFTRAGINKRVADVVIENGKIMSLGRRPAHLASLPVYDATGKYILPGLIDTHWHMDYAAGTGENVEALGSLFRYGVTTAFDPNGAADSFAMSDKSNQVGYLGTRLLTSGPNISRIYSGGYTIASGQIADELVGALRERGAALIKSYQLGSIEQQHRLTSAASRLGLGVTVESNLSTASDMDSVVLGGANSFEHWGPTFAIGEDWIEMLRDSGVSITPTFDVMDRQWHYFPGTKGGCRAPGAGMSEFLWKKVQESAQDSNPSYEPKVDRWAQELAKLARGGVRIDVGSHGIAPGIGFHWELRILASAMGAEAALRAATINGAHKLNVQDKLGSIAVGKIADLLIVEGDPTANIDNLLNIDAVVRNGNLVPGTKDLRCH